MGTSSDFNLRHLGEAQGPDQCGDKSFSFSSQNNLHLQPDLGSPASNRDTFIVLSWHCCLTASYKTELLI